MNFYVSSDQPTSSYSRLDSGDYELIVRQQPREALLAQSGKEKNRKPIDPPPIVQLKVPEIKDPIRQFLQSPYLFMMCHLEPEDSSVSVQEAKEALIGSISSSLHRLKDINNEDGGFFVFGDISVKLQGTHRLRFTLMELQRDESRVVSLRSTLSEPFIVVPQKQWRGLEESTSLSRTFSDQGVRLRLRKENRTMRINSQKRSYQTYQEPGPSSVTGEQTGSVYGASPDNSQYGLGEALPKRQRSDDYGHQGAYLGERAAPTGYPPLSAYPLQSGAPRQSPQTAYGFQQPPTSMSSSVSSYYGQAQTGPGGRSAESGSRQTHVADSGGSFDYPTSGMSAVMLEQFPDRPSSSLTAKDPAEYFARRPIDTYGSLHHTPTVMTPTVTGTPSETFHSSGQTMFSSSGAGHSGRPSSMYQHSNMTSPMGPATGSSTSTHTPSSNRHSTLNPSAPSFTLPTQSVASQQLTSQTYPSVPEHAHYSYGHQPSQQYPPQAQQQTFHHAPPSSLQHLTQPLPAPHQQRPPDPNDPYPPWQPYGQ